MQKYIYFKAACKYCRFPHQSLFFTKLHADKL